MEARKPNCDVSREVGLDDLDVKIVVKKYEPCRMPQLNRFSERGLTMTDVTPEYAVIA